ncbi:MAG TPA: dual specificity protein phosphatase [Syntrophorhabdaceae bacterium]|jgi:protein-tyrosine phosphatase
MDYILENLAIGNFDEATAPAVDIDALLCVAGEKELSFVRRLYCKVPLEDMQPIPAPQLIQAVRFIREYIADHRIMVFCNAGVGRAPSVVVAYLCCIENYGFGEAVEFAASRKPYMSILPDLILSIDKAKGLLARPRAKSA